jgi:tetratricopeptide (TPR) repeat protein
MIPSSRYLIPLLIAAAVTLCSGADRPSAEQWAPVAQAITAQDPAALSKVVAITTAFPAWSEGFRTLAQLQLRAKAFGPAATAARTAIGLDPSDSAAGACAVQALAQLGQVADAYAVADQFGGAKDAQGLVNFQAASAALSAKDRAKADHYLGLAMARTANAPAEFTYLDARIAEAAGDLKRAAISLGRATATNSRFWDAWYELGGIQAKLSETAGDHDTAIELLTQSEASLSKAANGMEKDFQGWQGLGSTQLRLATALMPSNPVDGKAKAHEAATSLRSSLALKEDQRDAQLGLGQALLLSEDYAEAIPHLERARALGAQDRALSFNLMLAYQKAGKTAEFEQAASALKAESPSEKITSGMGLYHAGQMEPAAKLLASVVGDLDRDQERERLGAVYRFLGHAQLALADQARTRAAPAAEIDQHLDAARDAYRAAGDLGDFPARHHFLALETQRSADAGYAAGWHALAWSSYASPAGWAAVIGNYGGAATGGAGITGLWNRHPVHVVVWGLLVLIPAVLVLISLLSRGPSYDHDSAEPVRRPSGTSAPLPPPRSGPSPVAKNRTPHPGPPQGAKHRTPHPGQPPVAKHRTPQPPPAKPPPAKPRPSEPGKAVTEAAVRPKVETEPSLTTVHAPTRSKDVEPDPQGALERRPTKPSSPSGPNRRPPPSRPS